MERLFALVDCNNFYASCERVFNPRLRGKPIVVLSNNDGCVVARSNEAKDCGIGMGVPIHEVEALVKKHNVQVFSSNYELYADMSSRVMQTLAVLAPEMEVYSIDEAFLRLEGIRDSLTDFARHIRQTVIKWTGIPVSIGIATTKTLAKVANRTAKKNPEYGGVLELRDASAIDCLLEKMEVGDVWGIGRQHTKLLNRYGVLTAKDFRDLNDLWIRKHMTVVGLRIAWELRGRSCLGLESVVPAKKSIVSSRSFGKMVTSIEGLREAVATYMTRAAEKLRAQDSVASLVSVFIKTNPFKEEPQYNNAFTLTLPEPSNYTPYLIGYAHKALDVIYKSGYRYKKAGVMLLEIVPETGVQMDLLETADVVRNSALMNAMDALNHKFGKDTVRLAACGNRKPKWKMRQEKCSPRYTTVLSEIPVVTLS